MRENYFQRKFKDKLEKKGYLVWAIADQFTGGIPDTYVAKDGWCAWYELKVCNKEPGQIVHLDDRKSSSRGFTREQAVKAYKLQEKGIDALGILYLAHDKKTVKIEPKDFDSTFEYEELLDLPEFEKF